MADAGRAEAEIMKALSVLHSHGEVIELRAPKAGRAGTVSGYFDAPAALAREALGWENRAPGVYVTLHAIEPALLARARNRVVEHACSTTGNSDVLRYRWLPIDLDPARPSGISSTDGEHEIAIARAYAVLGWLVEELGVSSNSIVVANSGNGAHVLVRIDEPSDATTEELVKRAIAAVDLRWTTADVTVDTSVSNPARIWRLYGTLARKGDETADRPHRRSRLLHVPDSITVASRADLERLAALVPVDIPRHGGARRDGQALDVAAWLDRVGIQVARSRPWQGGTLHELDGCPMDDTHERDRAAYVVQHASGAPAAGCHHARCNWTWRELRDRFEPRSANARENYAKDAKLEGSEVASFVILSKVERKSVPWLWQGKIPLGRPTVLDGDPDVGKSTVAYDIAARVTTGRPMPFETAPLIPASGVVILSAEDDAADTIRPRIDAAQGDCSRIAVFKIENPPDLDDNGLSRIEEAILDVGAKFVIVDPLMAFIPDKRDTFRDHEMRRAMRPLSALATRTGAAPLVIRHLTKGEGTNAKYRGGGSIGILGAARSAMLVAPDPDDPQFGVLARVKCNLAPWWPSLQYELVPADGCAFIKWIGESGHRADSLLATPGPRQRPIDDAGDFLETELARGARPESEIRANARRAGIAPRTLSRAKRELGVESRKQGKAWDWHLPGTPDPASSEECHSGEAESGILRRAPFRGVI